MPRRPAGATTAAGQGTILRGSGSSQTVVRYAVASPSGRDAHVGDARYRVLGARATAGNPGEVVLALRVRMANDDR